MCGEDLGPLNKQINQDTGFYQFGERPTRFRLPSGGFLRWEMGGSGTNDSNGLLPQPRPTQVLTRFALCLVVFENCSGNKNKKNMFESYFFN